MLRSAEQALCDKAILSLGELWPYCIRSTSVDTHLYSAHNPGNPICKRLNHSMERRVVCSEKCIYNTSNSTVLQIEQLRTYASLLYHIRVLNHMKYLCRECFINISSILSKHNFFSFSFFHRSFVDCISSAECEVGVGSKFSHANTRIKTSGKIGKQKSIQKCLPVRAGWWTQTHDTRHRGSGPSTTPCSWRI